MRKKYIFGKKLYISVLTSILVLLTTVATTFAWVGVFANSTFETFNATIRVSNLDEYNIDISLDGINFAKDGIIEGVELQKQILLNWGYSESVLNNDEKINYYFSKLNQDQCTTLPVIKDGKITSLGDFVDVYGDKTNKYFKFDLYISAKKVIDVNSSSSDFHLDIFLDENLMSGRRAKERRLFNPVTFKDNFINPYDQMIENNLMSLPDGYRTVKAGETIISAKIDPASAARMAFEKYEVVEKYHPEQYSEESKPQSAVIYQHGYEYPVYDEINNIYNFGAILPNGYNFSTINYNLSEWQYAQQGHWVMDLPTDIWETRGVESPTKDLVLSKDNNHLIDSTNPKEQIDVEHMMKITTYFWFEGWDADCFNSINASIVDFNITLLMSNEDED